MRSVIFSVCLLLSVLCAANVAVPPAIPVWLQNPAQGRSSAEVLSAGIPLPRGTFHAAKGPVAMELVPKAGGAPIPAEGTILSRWPQDGTLRWLRVDFQTGLDGSAKSEYTLRLKPVPLPRERTVLRAEENADRIKVNTGAAEFTFDRNNFRIFSSVKVNGKELLDKSIPGGLSLSDQNGTEYRADLGKPDSVKLEFTNAFRAVIRAEGWFFSAEGEKLGRYTIRVRLSRDSREAEIHFNMLFTHPGDKAKYGDIALTIPVRAGEVRFGGVQEPFELAEGNGKYLLQYDDDKFLVGDSAAPAKWSVGGAGKRAPGWMWTPAVAIHVEDFFQTYPNELEATADKGVSYHFWPKHGVAMPDRPVTSTRRQYLTFCHEGKLLDFVPPREYWDVDKKNRNLRYVREGVLESCVGVSKSAALRVRFLPESNPAQWTSRAKLMAEPPVVTASPEWMCSSGVFGPIHPYDPEHFPKIEDALSRCFDCELRLLDSQHSYGKWNYGDGHTDWDDKKGIWREDYRCWKGFHHLSGLSNWLLFVRSGDLKYHRRAVAASRHVMDVDMCHWTDPAHETIKDPGLSNARRKIPGALCDYKGLTHWHAGWRLFDYNAQTAFMLHYSCFTGDDRGVDSAMLWGNSALKNFDKPYDGRNGAGVAQSLLDLYLYTGDKRFCNVAKQNVDCLMASQFTPESPWRDDKMNGMMHAAADDHELEHRPQPIGAFPHWVNYAPWLESYWELTGDKEAKRRMILWADSFLAGWGGLSSWVRNRDVMNVMAYAYRFTGKVKYLEFAAYETDLFCKAVKRAPGTLLDGRRYRSENSLDHYIFIRLPLLMTALQEHGKPVTPIAPEIGIGSFPFVLTKHTGTSIVKHPPEYLVRNDSGREAYLSCKLGIIRKRGRHFARLIAFDGKVLWEKTTPWRNYENLRIPVPADGKLCRLQLGSAVWVDLSGDAGLKFVTRWGIFDSQCSGGRTCFRIPAGTKEVTLKLLDRSAKRSTNLQVVNSAGAVLREVDFYPEKKHKELAVTIPVMPEEAGKVWSIRGHFSRVLISAFADGKEIPYCSPSPEAVFDPEP